MSHSSKNGRLSVSSGKDQEFRKRSKAGPQPRGRGSVWGKVLASPLWPPPPIIASACSQQVVATWFLLQLLLPPWMEWGWVRRTGHFSSGPRN